MRASWRAGWLACSVGVAWLMLTGSHASRIPDSQRVGSTLTEERGGDSCQRLRVRCSDVWCRMSAPLLLMALMKLMELADGADPG